MTRKLMNTAAWTAAAATGLAFVSVSHADIIVGAGPGGGPQVQVYGTGGLQDSFLAFPPAFSGGVRVAAGDVNGDGIADIVTGAGAGGAGGHVRVFDGAGGGELSSFFAYSTTFSGGVHVASGDVNGDGFADIVTGAGAGATGGHVKVFNGSTGAELRSFLAYPASFAGGVRVASGDVNGDGIADIVTGAGPGGGPHIKVFDGVTGVELSAFFAYEQGFLGGVYVASGDVNGDGFADIVTGTGSDDATNAPAHVKVFDGQSGGLLSSFFAFDAAFMGGVRVATGDIDGDGLADIITGAGPGGGPHVKVFSGADGSVLESFMPFGPSFTGGVYVAAVPAPGAGLAGLCLLALARRSRR
jgi:hypothetical protein